jgi:hypothetical protein
MVAVGRREYPAVEFREGDFLDLPAADGFRFLEMADVADVMKREGFGVQARLERTSYPDEIETRRGYLLARRQG